MSRHVDSNEGSRMRFEHVTYEEKTGRNSKQIETYNFHKAAAVLAEYGFDCIRLSDDWSGADFLAHHRDSKSTLQVQLKAALVVDEKYLPHEELYMCFPLDGTGNWYLISHRRLMEIAKEKAPQWFGSKRWKRDKMYWSWSGNKVIREALEEFAYKPKYENLGFREAAQLKEAGHS